MCQLGSFKFFLARRRKYFINILISGEIACILMKVDPQVLLSEYTYFELIISESAQLPIQVLR